MSSISVLASDLNIHTFQGIVRDGDGYILPTMDSRLIRVNPDGSTKTLIQFCDGFDCERFGVPFGIVASQGSFYLTVSSFLAGGRLIRVSPHATVTDVADFTPLTPMGAPFGMIETQITFPTTSPVPQSLASPSSLPQPSILTWVVALSPNVLQSKGMLVRVTADGTITPIADISEYGIPFNLVERNGKYIVAQERGYLVEVSPDGAIAPLINFREANLGIPLGVAVYQDSLVVAINAGPLVRLDADGTPSVIVNLSHEGHAFPFAVLAKEDSLIVATTSGKLVRIVPQE